MKTIRFVLVAVLMSLGAGDALSGGAQYICVPCGCAHDHKTFDKPGRCPSCGMELVKKDAMIDVAIVVFEGVQIIDFTGPYEVFGQSNYRVFTVSESGAPLTTTMGLKIDPTYSLKDSPAPDVLVVPGGSTKNALNSKALMKWIVDQSATAQYVLSVCNGAFVLAAGGLLDGKSATTFYQLLEQLETTAKKTRVVWDQRFVDNGKVITTAGLSSGIDGALHVISKLEGPTKAKRVALHLEYDWRPQADYARAALADMHLPRLKPVQGGHIETLATDGNRRRWTSVYSIRGAKKISAVPAAIRQQLAEAGWKQGATKPGVQTLWTFTDRHKRAWSARTVMTMHRHAVDLRIESWLTADRPPDGGSSGARIPRGTLKAL